MSRWKLWLCAFTFHTYVPRRIIAGHVIDGCTFCGKERM